MPRKFLTGVDLNKNELQNARVQNLASAPSAPVRGQLYYDTAAERLYYWNGSAWVNRASDSDLLQGQNGAHYLARANHTGTQTAGTISDFDTQVRTNRLDQMAAPTAAVAYNGQKITGLGTPTADADAATKAYVDATAQGLDPKGSVRATTTGNVALSGLQTVDGVALGANDRVLVKDQTTASQNGIYVVAAGAWTRAPDADTSAEVTPGMFVFVEEGSDPNANSGWVLTTDGPITLGTTALTFVQFSGAGQITAGAGFSKTGNTFNIGQGLGIVIGADDVAIDTAVVARKFAGNVGDGVAVSYTVTHNLGSRDVVVAVYDNASPFAEVMVDIEHATTTAVILRFAEPPALNAYRVVVHG